jgi:hypothetical protein
MNIANARWSALQLRTLVEAALREAPRLEAALQGAVPGTRDRARLLTLACQDLADRCRSMQHHLECELPGHDADAAPRWAP